MVLARKKGKVTELNFYFNDLKFLNYKNMHTYLKSFLILNVINF